MNQYTGDAWTPQQDHEVMRRRRMGESLGEIARVLGLSKNAVISRWNRKLKPYIAREPQLPPTAFPPPGHCRYPVTREPPHRFCGEPGEPWCPAHALIVHIRTNPLDALE